MITDITKHREDKETKARESKDETIIKALRERCESSKPFNSMCHVFALRERTRRQITLDSLKQSMLKEGFKFTKQQYAEELKFMAGLGLGKLVLNKKGVVMALSHVTVTLQSIGLAAVSRREDLVSFKPSPKYKDLGEFFEVSASKKPLPELLEKKSPPVAKPDDFQVYLTLVIDGKILQYDLRTEFTTKELFSLMVKARGVK